MAVADLLSRHACPLVHPADFSVKVRDRTVKLYEGGSLVIFGHRFHVVHDVPLNFKERSRLMDEAENDPGLRDELKFLVSQKCPQSLILWLNYFAWTFVKEEVDHTGHKRGLVGSECHHPFVTWPIQDQFITNLFFGIVDGFDLCVDKSRQMGATWQICATFLWFFLYHPEMAFEVLSRVEALVDNPEDPKSLFWKMDYMLRWMPPWIVPEIERRRLNLSNKTLGSTINGRSTTEAQGRGGSLNAVLFDEASQVDYLEPIWIGYQESTSCRIASSTPFGPGYFSKLVRDPSVTHMRLPWFNHPTKGRGRYMATDPDNGEQFVSSPFYEVQCAKNSPDPSRWWLGRKTKGVAQELDMDHVGSGALFFDYPVLIRQIEACPPHPEFRGDLLFLGRGETKRLPYLRKLGETEDSTLDYISWQDSDRGGIELWCDLEEDENGIWRPNQNRNYAIGCDISQGVGSSESVASVFCIEESRKVGQFCTSALSPERFAIATAMLGFWFGGERGFSLLNWETNGYGQGYGRTLVKIGYPWLFSDEILTERSVKRTKRIGWTSSRLNKRTAFEAYRAALARGEFTNPSKKALEQAAEIVNYANQDGSGAGIGPAGKAHESSESRELHADCVTADAVVWMAAQRLPLVKPKERRAPIGSAAYRRRHPELFGGRIRAEQ